MTTEVVAATPEDPAPSDTPTALEAISDERGADNNAGSILLLMLLILAVAALLLWGGSIRLTYATGNRKHSVWRFFRIIHKDGALALDVTQDGFKNALPETLITIRFGWLYQLRLFEKGIRLTFGKKVALDKTPKKTDYRRAKGMLVNGKSFR